MLANCLASICVRACSREKRSVMNSKVVEKTLNEDDIIREDDITWEEESDLLKSIFVFVTEAVMMDRAQGKILSFAFGSSVSTAIDDELKSALGPLGVFVTDEDTRTFPYSLSLMFDTSKDAINITHFCLVILHTISMYKSKWFWMRASIIDTVENFYQEVEGEMGDE